MNPLHFFHFDADFWDDEVQINQSAHFLTNEILTELFCMDSQADKVKYLTERLSHAEQAVFLDNDGQYYSEEYVDRFDRNIRNLASYVEETDAFRLTFPPYCQLYPDFERLDRVYSILNQYPSFWGRRFDSPPFEDSGFIIEHSDSYTPHYLSTPEAYHVPDMEYYTTFAPITDFHTMLGQVRSIVADCQAFLNDVAVRFEQYKVLFDQYIHSKNHFPPDAELSELFRQYDLDHPDSTLENLLHAKNMKSIINVTNYDGKPIISERITFESLADFLYVDFMRGLKNNHLPKRCSNCGRWFLIRGGKYLEYCSRPLEADPTKTCRDVGAQQSFDQKCKNNPIWEVHRRAYKTHFARRKKGRMTPDEFRIWVDNAIIWRGQAERGELDFDTYCAMLKK